MLVIPGGGTTPVLEGKLEPIRLIAAFAALPAKEEGKTRWLLSVCTGSLLLAEAGVLGGLSATTHFMAYDELRQICGVKEKEGQEAVKVLDERFVVNPRSEVNGLRIITSGGVSCGMDSSLWLVSTVFSHLCSEAVGMMRYARVTRSEYMLTKLCDRSMSLLGKSACDLLLIRCSMPTETVLLSDRWFSTSRFLQYENCIQFLCV